MTECKETSGDARAAYVETACEDRPQITFEDGQEGSPKIVEETAQEKDWFNDDFLTELFDFEENVLNSQVKSNESVNKENQEKSAKHNLRIGKRKQAQVNSDSSEFVDSSDENFENEDGEDSGDSDAPSEALEDIEGSSEDDIFIEKSSTKRDLIKKLKTILKRQRRAVHRGQSQNLHIDEGSADWYTDPEDDEDIDRTPASDDESPRLPQYIDGQNMKNFEMKPCLKFANVDVYRKAFRDWSVRKGYEFEFVKNERSRVTAMSLPIKNNTGGVYARSL
ncbi:hypothetical protein CDL12_14873 [Handroanthus impetiginosus]|uniref:Transposase MuDR plant domain-containing protein n=1 Tax=Handroanthus impetiginosus TaxID=429701 RepID=A0A2G9H4T0_9LAMI|nr:hypothetical protein CDL12_14873 [Handroanthus impetiginosus]